MSHHHDPDHQCCGHHQPGDAGCCGGHHHDPVPPPEPEPEETCSSGGCSSCAGCSPQLAPGREGAMTQIEITPDEEDFLKKLAQTPYLPLAEFFLTSSQEADLTNTVLAPVFLETGEESMQEIRNTGKVLKRLEEKELVTLDYNKPLKNADANFFLDSSAFQILEETVEQGQELSGALFDTANLGMGSISLTQLGQVVIDQLEYL